MKRRTVIGLGAGVAAAGAVGTLGVLGVRSATPYAPARPLRRGDLAADEFDVRFANYRLRVADGRLTLTTGRDLVWASGGAFVLAGRGRKEWHDRLGHFHADTDHDAVFNNQTIEIINVDDRMVTITGRLRDDDDRNNLTYTLTLIADEYGLTIDLVVPTADFTVLRIGLATEEQVHGAGEQFTTFNLRDYSFNLVTREQGVGRGRQPLTILSEATNGAGGSPTTTYAPIPFLVTSTMRSVSWANDEVAEIDTRAENSLDIIVWAAQLLGYVEIAGDPPTLMRSHTRRTGRMAALPRWTGEGSIIGLQGGNEVVREKLAALTAAKTAITGVWLQDWVGRRVTDFGSRLWWTWELDRQRYPDWDAMVGEFAAQGLRTLTYVNPFIVDPATKPAPVARNLYQEAIDNTFLVRNRDGAPYLLDQGGFDATLVDLSNPAARDWFADVIATQVAPAATGGWMADFGEGLPFDAVLHEGSPAEWHNRYPAAWAELNASVRARVGGDRLVFHRSGWRGSAANTGAFWAGDQMVDWDVDDGMASALRGILAGGVSGLTINHTDIGGYTGLAQPIVGVSRTAELLTRWAEWAAWTPLFRTHEGNRPDEQVQAYDPEVLTAFAAQSRVFAALADYRDEVLAQAAADGMPAMRHCWVHHPGTLAAGYDNQYFYGDRFFVAPVFNPGYRSRTVAFPPGAWTHVWTGKIFAGNQVGGVPSELGQTPVFYRHNDPIAAQIAAQVRRASL